MGTRLSVRHGRAYVEVLTESKSRETHDTNVSPTAVSHFLRNSGSVIGSSWKTLSV